MHIIQELEGLIGWVIKQILIVAGLIFAAAAAPVILIVLPQLLLITSPKSDFQSLVLIFIWTTPVAVSLWMAFLCHIHSIRLWVRRGQSPEWFKAHGGFVRVNIRSTGYMFLGLFGSFVCEMLLLLSFKYIPYGSFSGAARYSLWFALFPFAAFTPVLLLLFKRGNYSEPLRLKADDPQWLAYLEVLRAEEAAKAVRKSDDNFLKGMGIA
jgi:hypothetical protein